MLADTDIGASDTWEFCDTSTNECVNVTGKLLGFATSRHTRHNHHRNEQPIKPCHACRWFEVRIIKVDGASLEYVVSYQGHSILPGEKMRDTVCKTSSPYTVVEVLTMHQAGSTYIPRPSRIALSEAASRDTGIEQVWIDRAI